jgi:hypothetical protein
MNTAGYAADWKAAGDLSMQHFLYLRPLPQGQKSLRSVFGVEWTNGCGFGRIAAAELGSFCTRVFAGRGRGALM